MTTSSLADFRLLRPLAKHAQITAFLRDQIISGALAPEARLPTTQALAAQWSVPIATIQAAFVPLVKEGLLLRRPGLGTLVRQSAPALKQIGIYQPVVLDWHGGERFAYRLADMVEAHLATAGIVGTRLVDRRASGQRTEPLPELLQAAHSRQLDAVIVTEADERCAPWLERLPVPIAFYGSGRGTNEVWFDFDDFAAQGLARLAAQGCRRVGLISVLSPDAAYAPGTRPFACDLHAAFVTGVAAHGLVTRPEWIRAPQPGDTVSEGEAEHFGYAQAHAIWSAAERPDGLLIYTDRAARGAVMALLALGAQAAPPKLVLHRNAELGLFCPLHADYLEASISATADRLIAIINAQHQRKPADNRPMAFQLTHG